jgi:chaperonin GroEL
MESARDCATRTVSEAGDGTTTATVLAYALVRYGQEFLRNNPRTSPQRMVQEIRQAFEKVIEPLISKLSSKVRFDSPKGRRTLLDVATISANGDRQLAESVMKAFDLVGDAGTVTIVERSGPTGYQVERIHGYPVAIGYEESCQKFMTEFVNDAGSQRVWLKNPSFVLYNGAVLDVQTLVGLMDRIQGGWAKRPGTQFHRPDQPYIDTPNVVLVATGFSEQVLGTLALNMSNPMNINMVPMVIPRSPLMNGEVHFLNDLSALTGATIFNPLSRPLDTFDEETYQDLGRVFVDESQPGEFEMFRFRTTIIGRNDEDEVADRAEEVKAMVEGAVSEFDKRLLQERLACLTGGIAKLTVIGSSNGELRERKDRADDAVRSVQGAIKAGVLPGGGWTLLRLAEELRRSEQPETVKYVVCSALREPVLKLLLNTGLNLDEVQGIIENLVQYMTATINSDEPADWVKPKEAVVFDAANFEAVKAFDSGILDSTPAVLEAIRNSISIASLHSTFGTVIVFKRDHDFEREEAAANNEFIRNAHINEADQRA